MEENIFSNWKRGARTVSFFLFGMAIAVIIGGLGYSKIYQGDPGILKTIGFILLAIVIAGILFWKSKWVFALAIIGVIIWLVWYKAIPMWSPSITSPEQTASVQKVYSIEGKYEITAKVGEWSEPTIVPDGYRFVIDCKGCETGKRMDIMVNNKVITDGKTKWFHLSDNIPPPVSLKFKARELETNVSVTITKK